MEDIVTEVLSKEEREDLAKVLVLAEFIYTLSKGSTLADFKEAVLLAFNSVDRQRKEKRDVEDNEDRP